MYRCCEFNTLHSSIDVAHQAIKVALYYPHINNCMLAYMPN